jgi:hypothetical protein
MVKIISGFCNKLKFLSYLEPIGAKQKEALINSDKQTNSLLTKSNSYIL